MLIVDLHFTFIVLHIEPHLYQSVFFLHTKLTTPLAAPWHGVAVLHGVPVYLPRFRIMLLGKAQITLGLSRHVSTRHVRRVEPMHFGCVELVEQHGSTRSTRRTCRFVSRRDVTSQVEFGLNRGACGRATRRGCVALEFGATGD